MIKAKLISHIQELESIRNDKYMPEEIRNDVECLQLRLTKMLENELLKRSDGNDSDPNGLDQLVERLDHVRS